jgi:hypothetical protein
MRTTLQIDDDVLESAKQIAAADGRTIGAVISDLVRRALQPTLIRPGSSFPTFDVPADAPLITSDDVARAMDEE